MSTFPSLFLSVGNVLGFNEIFCLASDSVFIRTSDDDRSYSIMIDSRGASYLSSEITPLLINPLIVFAYTIGQIAPEYERVCDIRTDYTPMCTDANRLKGSKGDYWRIPLKVGKQATLLVGIYFRPSGIISDTSSIWFFLTEGICFGGTSLKAWVFWIENVCLWPT